MGGSYTMIKLGVATISPIMLIAGRTAIAGVLLLMVMRLLCVRMPTDLATWRRFTFQACLNSVIPWTLSPSTSSILALTCLAVVSTAAAFMIYFLLIQTLGSIGTTAQAYLRVPIGVALGVALLGESLSRAAWVGLVCVVIGVAAMTLPARTAAKPSASP